jgi:transposase
VRRVKQERREQNKVAPCVTRHRPPRWAPLSDRIRELIRHQPDLTLRELKAELKTDLSVQTLCVALQRLRLTVKKKCSSPRSESGRTLRRGGKSSAGSSRS